MEPSHHTQRLPAQDRPENQYAVTEQIPAADSGGRPGGHTGARTGWGTGTKVAVGAAVVLILLVVAAIGLELGLRKSIGDRLDREITTSMGSQADVDLGARPVLLSYFSGSLETVHITTDGTPAEGVAGPVPAIDITAEGVREEGDVTHVDSLSGTVFVSDEAMVAAAQSETDSGAGGMLGGLMQVQDITSDPDAGTLRVSISGLAEAVVTPRLTGGELELEPETASVFGFELPSELLGGTLSMMDSAMAQLPPGVELTGVHVVPGGMTVDLGGRDVVLESDS
ncbi:MAG TPA: DUF2993 domain-containing protein [Candidatus Dietzia intestinipullorum]|nr:DUF2993 domain-containing protein [Candidatus Dietzia intestinipullorum]